MRLSEGYTIDGYEAIPDYCFDNFGYRVKEIDSGFFIFFNHFVKCYEIHNSRQLGDTLSFSFKELDHKALQHIAKTVWDNNNRSVDDIISEIDQYNDRMVNEKEQKHAEKAREASKQALNFINNKPSYETLPNGYADAIRKDVGI